jgi:23S rRNA pseudouridine1911/1915/1917 synthase
VSLDATRERAGARPALCGNVVNPSRLRGHTLVGERRYTYGPDAIRAIEFPRQALHAQRLSFRHPEDGRSVSYEAPLPKDLARLLQALRLSK